LNGKQLVRHLLNLKERPTAIMTCNDLTAFGVIIELNEQGIDVPGEMSVIGFDNDRQAIRHLAGIISLRTFNRHLGGFFYF
jgi:DNA-binding LacI/PurR family transcriptional regulator